MAAGKWNMQKASGGVASITIADGVGATNIVLPESGTVATTSNIVGFKNYIINGNFDIWQRGISHTTNATINYGSADRWRTINLETTNLVSTRQEVSGVVPFQAKYFIRQTVPLNTTTGTVLDQFIEGLRQFSNKVVTLSMWVKGTAGKKIGLAFQSQYGTGGTPSTPENIIGSVYTLSGDWEKISITRTLPDFINGKTYGTDGNDCLRVAIGTQISSVSLTPEIFFQSGTFDIAQVQLEEGSVATPFENRPIGLELSLCQRYYENNGTARCEEFRNTTVASTQFGAVRFNVQKRISPTVTVYSDNFNTINNVAEGNGNNISCTIGFIGDTGFRLSWTNTPSVSGASFKYTASAEL